MKSRSGWVTSQQLSISMQIQPMHGAAAAAGASSVSATYTDQHSMTLTSRVL